MLRKAHHLHSSFKSSLFHKDQSIIYWTFRNLWWIWVSRWSYRLKLHTGWLV